MNTGGELLLTCADILQYCVPCLSLNYMNKTVSDSRVTILRIIILIHVG